jgi:hypothetical protein
VEFFELIIFLQESVDVHPILSETEKGSDKLGIGPETDGLDVLRDNTSTQAKVGEWEKSTTPDTFPRNPGDTIKILGCDRRTKRHTNRKERHNIKTIHPAHLRSKKPQARSWMAKDSFTNLNMRII